MFFNYNDFCLINILYSGGSVKFDTYRPSKFNQKHRYETKVFGSFEKDPKHTETPLNRCYHNEDLIPTELSNTTLDLRGPEA